MPLETLRADGPLNIKRTSVETPTEQFDLLFDEKRDLPGFKDEMGIYLERAVEDEDIRDFVNMATSMAFLYPENLKKLENNSELFDRLEKYTQEKLENEDWADYLGAFYTMKLVFPQRMKDRNLEESKGQIAGLPLTELPDSIFLMQIMFLNGKRSLVELLKNNLKTTVEYLNEKNIDDLDVELTIQRLAGFKFSMPEIVDEILKSKKMRNRFKQYLKKYNQDFKPDHLDEEMQMYHRSYHLAKMAACLKVLSAEKVEITDDGFKLIMPEKPKEKDQASLPFKKEY